ncbi:MAG: hypothetical protein EKK57_10160 [Proteobacteria bacterium]|nr:MAG: hypothetical protein EKK57_10160 [Pseudomonadota bacterium]
MSNSIFNIQQYNASNAYTKYDIISFTGTFRGLSITNGYLYCIVDSATGTFNELHWDGYITDNLDIKPKFLWIPTVGNSVDSAPKVRVLKMGDGYESRIPNGINNNLLSYNLSFDNLSTSEATAIIHFLSNRNAQESFIWQGRPPYVQNLRYICREWNDTEIFTDNFSIRTKFEQVVN